MKDGRLFRCPGDAMHIFEFEYKKAKGAIKHPTHYEKKLEYEQDWQWLLEFDLNKEVESLLEKYREKLK